MLLVKALRGASVWVRWVRALLLGAFPTGPAGSETVLMKYVTNTCPACGGSFEFLESEIGREWQCPHCKAAVRLNYVMPQGRHANVVAWRWIAVLPAAIGSYAVVMLLSALAVSDERPDDPLPPSTNVLEFYEIIAHPIAGYLFVWMGTRVAPGRKMTVAIALAVLFGIAYTVVVMSGLEMISVRRFYIGWSTFRGLLGTAGAIAAAGAVHHREMEEERQKHRVKPGIQNN